MGNVFNSMVGAAVHKPAVRELLDIFRYNQIDFFQMAYEQNPDDLLARQFLINWHISSLDYAIHEVPQGVLGDKAWLEDTLAKLEPILQSADLAEKYRERLKLWRFHVDAWQDYLARRSEFKNYAEYLDKNANGFDWRVSDKVRGNYCRG